MEINFGLKPFWFWNGKMDNGEIARQIKDMSDKGVGGFFIHPRQGSLRGGYQARHLGLW